MTFEAIRSQLFPVELPANVIGREVDKQTVFEVGYQMKIFDPVSAGHFQTPPSRQEKAQQLAATCVESGAEAVAFYDSDGNPVGWFWGFMEYADTFTIDTFGLIPAYRGRGIYSAFIRVLLAYLTAVGYERVTVCTHPDNRAMLIANLKAGFNIAGMELKESTGALVKLVCHLHADRRADFSKAFRLPT